MFRWLSNQEEHATSEVCSCRGEMEVMESRLLMSVNTISRMVGPDRDPRSEGEVEVRDTSASGADEGGAWWI